MQTYLNYHKCPNLYALRRRLIPTMSLASLIFYGNILNISHDSVTVMFNRPKRIFDFILYQGPVFGRQRLEQIFVEWGVELKLKGGVTSFG